MATRAIKTFSLEKEVLKEIERTKGLVSTSERVNHLLKLALESERLQSLHYEAAEFFSTVSDEDNKGRAAFQAASVKSLARE